MNSIISEFLIFNVVKSQVEIPTWQLFPGLILLAFLGVGIHQAWESYKLRRKMGFRGGQQRNTRRKVSLPLIINTPVTQEFSVKTFDVSVSGAFLSYEDLKTSMTFTSLIGKRSGIKVGDLVDIKILTGRFSSLSCQARVIRYNFEKDSMPPQGIGIEFVNLTPRKRRVLESLIFADEEEIKLAS